MKHDKNVWLRCIVKYGDILAQQFLTMNSKQSSWLKKKGYEQKIHNETEYDYAFKKMISKHLLTNERTSFAGEKMRSK